jgi:hypothetical protein
VNKSDRVKKYPFAQTSVSRSMDFKIFGPWPISKMSTDNKGKDGKDGKDKKDQEEERIAKIKKVTKVGDVVLLHSHFPGHSYTSYFYVQVTECDPIHKIVCVKTLTTSVGFVAPFENIVYCPDWHLPKNAIISKVLIRKLSQDFLVARARSIEEKKDKIMKSTSLPLGSLILARCGNFGTSVYWMAELIEKSILLYDESVIKTNYKVKFVCDDYIYTTLSLCQIGSKNITIGKWKNVSDKEKSSGRDRMISDWIVKHYNKVKELKEAKKEKETKETKETKSTDDKIVTSLPLGSLILAKWGESYWMAELVEKSVRLSDDSTGNKVKFVCDGFIAKMSAALHIIGTKNIAIGKWKDVTPTGKQMNRSTLLSGWILKHYNKVKETKELEMKKGKETKKEPGKDEKKESKTHKVGSLVFALYQDAYWIAEVIGHGEKGDEMVYVGDNTLCTSGVDIKQITFPNNLRIGNWKSIECKSYYRKVTENNLLKWSQNHIHLVQIIKGREIIKVKREVTTEKEKEKEIFPDLICLSNQIIVTQKFISKLSSETIAYEQALAEEHTAIERKIKKDTDLFQSYQILKPVISDLEVDCKMKESSDYLSAQERAWLSICSCGRGHLGPEICAGSSQGKKKATWAFMETVEQAIRSQEHLDLMGDYKPENGLKEFKTLLTDVNVRLKAMTDHLEKYPLDQFYTKTHTLIEDLALKAKTLFFSNSLRQVKRKCNLVQEMCYKQAELESLSQEALQLRQIEKHLGLEQLFQKNVQDMWTHMKNLRKGIAELLIDPSIFITDCQEKQYQTRDPILADYLRQKEDEHSEDLKRVLAFASYFFGEFIPEKKKTLDAQYTSESGKAASLFKDLKLLEPTVLTSANLACQSWSKSKRLEMILTKYLPLYEGVWKEMIKTHVTRLENYKTYLNSMNSVLSIRDEIISLLTSYVKHQTIDFKHQVSGYVCSMETLACNFYNKRLKSLIVQQKQLVNRNQLKIKRIEQFRVAMNEALEAADETIFLEFVTKVEQDQKDKAQIAKSLDQVDSAISETSKDPLFKELCANHKIQAAHLLAVPEEKSDKSEKSSPAMSPRPQCSTLYNVSADHFLSPLSTVTPPTSPPPLVNCDSPVDFILVDEAVKK